jgi:hypothetical protein
MKNNFSAQHLIEYYNSFSQDNNWSDVNLFTNPNFNDRQGDVVTTLTNFISDFLHKHMSLAREIQNLSNKVIDTTIDSDKKGIYVSPGDIRKILIDILQLADKPLELKHTNNHAGTEVTKLKTFFANRSLRSEPILKQMLQAYIPPFLSYHVGIRELPESALAIFNGLRNSPGFVWKYETLLTDESMFRAGRVTFLTALYIINQLESQGEINVDLALELKLEILLGALQKEVQTPAAYPVLHNMLLGALQTYGTTASLTKLLQPEALAVQDVVADILDELAANLVAVLAANQDIAHFKALFVLANQLDLDLTTLIVHLLKQLGDQDTILALNRMYGTNPKLADLVVQDYATFKQRPVLAAAELDELLNSLETKHLVSLEELTTAIDTIVGEEDFVSFDFNDKQVFVANHRVEGSVQIATAQQTVSLNLTITAKDKSYSRTLVVEVPWTLDNDLMHVNLLAGEVELPVVDKLHQIIASVIYEKSGLARLNKSNQSPTKVNQVQPATLAPITRISREARKQAYNDLQANKKVKRKRYATSNAVAEEQQLPVSSANTPRDFVARKIANLDQSTIQTFLDAAAIEHSVVSAMEIQDFLESQLIVANTDVTYRLGKPVETNVPEIQLRQLSISKGSHAIRIYLEPQKGGNFVVRGILYKKSERQQSKYIEELATQIAAERAES